MSRKETPKRRLMLAAVHAECCIKAHVLHRRLRPMLLVTAFNHLEEWKDTLEEQGFDVNEAYLIEV